ncbi:MAG: hypothetical protein VKQ33_04285 [Candidatus Sericytochromatia bacterium]|nr:hypothetical protein [Candidatus Sericytochromatia bacterium]
MGLIGPDGGTLIGPDGGTLIGLDGGTLIGVDAGTLIGPDGGTLTQLPGSGLAPEGLLYALRQAAGTELGGPCELAALLSDDRAAPPMMRELAPLAVLAEPLRLMLVAYATAASEERTLAFERFKMLGLELNGRLRLNRKDDTGAIHIWLRGRAGEHRHVGTVQFTAANRGTLMAQAVVPFLGLLALRGSFDLGEGEAVLDLATFPSRPGFALLPELGTANQVFVRQRIELQRRPEPDGTAFTYRSAFARSFLAQAGGCGAVRRSTTGKFLSDNSGVVTSRQWLEGSGVAGSSTWHLGPAGAVLAPEAIPAALQALEVGSAELLEAPASATELSPGEQQLFYMPPPPEVP